MFTVSGPASRVLYPVFGKIISTTNMLWAARAITATDLLVDGHNLRIAACSLVEGRQLVCSPSVRAGLAYKPSR